MGHLCLWGFTSFLKKVETQWISNWLTSWAYRTPKVRELKMVQKDSHARCHQHWLGKFETSRKTIAKPQEKLESNQTTQEVLGLLSNQRCMIQRIRKRIVIFHNNRNQTVNRFKSCLTWLAFGSLEKLDGKLLSFECSKPFGKTVWHQSPFEPICI